MQEELEEATQRVKELEGCEEEAAAIPALRQDLRTATARVDSLQQQVKSLQVTAAGAICGLLCALQRAPAVGHCAFCSGCQQWVTVCTAAGASSGSLCALQRVPAVGHCAHCSGCHLWATVRASAKGKGAKVALPPELQHISLPASRHGCGAAEDV